MLEKINYWKSDNEIVTGKLAKEFFSSQRNSVYFKFTTEIALNIRYNNNNCQKLTSKYSNLEKEEKNI